VDAAPPSDFESAFDCARHVEGWLTADQAHVLWVEATKTALDSAVVEIGSHRGRSTIMLAAGSPSRVTAVDPFVPDWRYGRPDTMASFKANLAAAGLADRVRLLAESSLAVRRRWTEPIGLLYIDGKHDYWTVSDDLRWAEFVVPGGRVLVHDAFSSIGVTLALLRHVLASRTVAYVDRTGSLARFEVRRPTLIDRIAFLAQSPWWLRNVIVKLSLRLRLRVITRLLGHTDSADPY
jgi:predicted O-methyltransferase YrrM